MFLKKEAASSLVTLVIYKAVKLASLTGNLKFKQNKVNWCTVIYQNILTSKG
jgi:hypothetical protein